MLGGKEFHIFGAEIRKAREPNERLRRGVTDNETGENEMIK